MTSLASSRAKRASQSKVYERGISSELIQSAYAVILGSARRILGNSEDAPP
ncbi:MAG TPA: hypothetical protein VGK73_11065 [Polyangiaceae bacterium]